jgi:hypothetical protein
MSDLTPELRITESHYSSSGSSTLGLTGPRPRVPIGSASDPRGQAINARCNNGSKAEARGKPVALPELMTLHTDA